MLLCVWFSQKVVDLIRPIKMQSNTTKHHTVGHILSPSKKKHWTKMFVGGGQHFPIRYSLVI